jgi:hypothetical protein
VQKELDANNAKAERYPLGGKEFWRARLVEVDWAESQQD